MKRSRCSISSEVRDSWLIARINKDRYVDILNRDFVEDYAEFTGASFTASCWGAPWCDLLSKDLLRLVRGKVLRRNRVGLSGNWQPGFPRWVYSYEIGYVGRFMLERMENSQRQSQP